MLNISSVGIRKYPRVVPWVIWVVGLFPPPMVTLTERTLGVFRLGVSGERRSPERLASPFAASCVRFAGGEVIPDGTLEGQLLVLEDVLSLLQSSDILAALTLYPFHPVA